MPTKIIPLINLRNNNWKNIPTTPGVYWWYFPAEALIDFEINQICDPRNLRKSPDGKLCLYVGVAESLRQRIEWHANQPLTQDALRSGWLSTFRRTLLTLNNFTYNPEGELLINQYFDRLSVCWQETANRPEAEQIEKNELQGSFQYPLNIKGNKYHTQLLPFTRSLKEKRHDYHNQHLQKNLIEEARYQNYLVRRLEGGSIEVEVDDKLKLPAKPHLRDLATKIGVSHTNANGNPHGTRQLGYNIIRKINLN